MQAPRYSGCSRSKACIIQSENLFEFEGGRGVWHKAFAFDFWRVPTEAGDIAGGVYFTLTVVALVAILHKTPLD